MCVCWITSSSAQAGPCPWPNTAGCNATAPSGAVVVCVKRGDGFRFFACQTRRDLPTSGLPYGDPPMSRQLMLVSVLTLLAGCATQSVPHASSAPTAIAETRAPQRITQGRYTRVSTEPLPAQHDLLAQIIDIRIPAS